jgi:hypothetical protein
MIVDNVDKGLLSCVNVLKNNTNRRTRTLSNVDSIDVSIAMTRLLQAQNKQYLDMYEVWLNEKLEDVDMPKAIVDNVDQIQ